MKAAVVILCPRRFSKMSSSKKLSNKACNLLEAYVNAVAESEDGETVTEQEEVAMDALMDYISDLESEIKALRGL
jgi:hypothetical protein